MVFESVCCANVDFGLVLSDKPPDGLKSHALKVARLCLFVSSTHALARGRLNLADLASVPFVVGPQKTDYTEKISRVLAHSGLSKYFVAARISNFKGVKEVVHAGLGTGLLTSFMIKREILDGALRELKVKDFHESATIMQIQRLTASRHADHSLS
jgi:DNA-binding transcriptional LysR family regulator